jgi:hypothetical protein
MRKGKNALVTLLLLTPIKGETQKYIYCLLSINYKLKELRVLLPLLNTCTTKEQGTR